MIEYKFSLALQLGGRVILLTCFPLLPVDDHQSCWGSVIVPHFHEDKGRSSENTAIGSQVARLSILCQHFMTRLIIIFSTFKLHTWTEVISLTSKLNKKIWDCKPSPCCSNSTFWYCDAFIQSKCKDHDNERQKSLWLVVFRKSSKIWLHQTCWDWLISIGHMDYPVCVAFLWWYLIIILLMNT